MDESVELCINQAADKILAGDYYTAATWLRTAAQVQDVQREFERDEKS